MDGASAWPARAMFWWRQDGNTWSPVAISEANTFSGIAQSLWPYATKTNLDFLGAIYGQPRLQRQDVASSGLDTNFTFSVARGNFGTINSGRDIVVPAGTQIFTAQGTSGPVMLISSAVTLPAAQSSVSFSVISLSAGAQGNAAQGIFTSSSFSNYTDAQYGSLLVTNNYGLIGGRDQETDDDYRYRVSLWLQSHGGAAESDLRLAILAVPGIQDVTFVRQAGTYLCYVYGISPVVPPSLLNLVQSQLDQITAYPLIGSALSAELTGISLATTVDFVSTAAVSDQQNALANGVTAAQNYINQVFPFCRNQNISRARQAEAPSIIRASPLPGTLIYTAALRNLGHFMTNHHSRGDHTRQGRGTIQAPQEQERLRHGRHVAQLHSEWHTLRSR